MPGSSDETMDDIYVCYDAQLTDLALEVLEEAGIECLLRDHASSAFPTNVGFAGKKVIAVPTHLVSQARTCLLGAVEDGILPGDGTVIEP